MYVHIYICVCVYMHIYRKIESVPGVPQGSKWEKVCTTQRRYHVLDLDPVGFPQTCFLGELARSQLATFGL